MQHNTKNENIHLPTQQLAAIRHLLREHFPDCESWAFGSRVTGEHLREQSDLDIVIKSTNPINLDRILALKYEFIESDLPFKVDVSDWNALDDTMQRSIAQHHIILTTAT